MASQPLVFCVVSQLKTEEKTERVVEERKKREIEGMWGKENDSEETKEILLYLQIQPFAGAAILVCNF